MTLTDEEQKALAWTIAMIRPRSENHNESISAKTADVLQGILDKATRGEKK